jgi:hypothetical protein
VNAFVRVWNIVQCFFCCQSFAPWLGTASRTESTQCVCYVSSNVVKKSYAHCSQLVLVNSLSNLPRAIRRYFAFSKPKGILEFLSCNQESSPGYWFFFNVNYYSVKLLVCLR